MGLSGQDIIFANNHIKASIERNGKYTKIITQQAQESSEKLPELP
jgi:hypothetical protein